jgi:hypothetical protein
LFVGVLAKENHVGGKHRRREQRQTIPLLIAECVLKYLSPDEHKMREQNQKLPPLQTSESCLLLSCVVLRCVALFVFPCAVLSCLVLVLF